MTELELNKDKTVKEAFFNGKGELVVYRKFGKMETIDIFEPHSRTWIKNPPQLDLKSYGRKNSKNSNNMRGLQPSSLL